MTEIREYVSTDTVAGWFGVTRQAVTNWIARQLGAPEPAAVIRRRRTSDEYVWSPDQERQWRDWYATWKGRTP